MTIASVLLSQLPITAEVALDTTYNLLVTDSSGNSTLAPISSILGLLAPVTPQSIGLGNVANVPPANLPISIATQEALNGKLNTTGTIPISQVVNLQETLTNIESSIVPLTIANIPDLQTILNSYLTATTSIPIDQVIGLQAALNTFMLANQSIPRFAKSS